MIQMISYDLNDQDKDYEGVLLANKDEKQRLTIMCQPPK